MANDGVTPGTQIHPRPNVVILNPPTAWRPLRGRMQTDQYEKLLADLPNLFGVGIDPATGEERQIDGAEFWRSGSIASQYTGRYGTDRLVGMIRGLIARRRARSRCRSIGVDP